MGILEGLKQRKPTNTYMLDFQKEYKNLKEKAESAGVSLGEAADREGVARSTLFRWENGEVDPLNTFNRICRRVDKIIGERNDDKRTIPRKRKSNGVESSGGQ